VTDWHAVQFLSITGFTRQSSLHELKWTKLAELFNHLFKNFTVENNIQCSQSETGMTIITTVIYRGSALTNTFSADRVQFLPVQVHANRLQVVHTIAIASRPNTKEQLERFTRDWKVPMECNVSLVIIIWRCPHNMRCGVYVTVGCPSVRLFVPSIDICCLPQPGRGQQISVDSCRRPRCGCGQRHVESQGRGGSTQTCSECLYANGSVYLSIVHKLQCTCVHYNPLECTCPGMRDLVRCVL